MTDSGGGHAPRIVVEGDPGQQTAESIASLTTPDQDIAREARALRVKPKRHWPQYLASKYPPPRNLTFRQLCAGYPNHLAEGLLVEMHLKGLTPNDILEMLPSDVQADMDGRNGRTWMETRIKCALARAGLGDDSSAPSSPSKSAPPSRPTTPKPFTITPRKRKQKEGGDVQLPNSLPHTKATLTEPTSTPSTQTDASNTPYLPHQSTNSSNIAALDQTGSQVPTPQASKVAPASAPAPQPRPQPQSDDFLFLISCREEIRKHRALIIDISRSRPEFSRISSQEEKENDVDLQWLTWCDRVNNSLRHSRGLEPVATRSDGFLFLRALERLLETHKIIRKIDWGHNHPDDHRTEVIAKMAYRDAKEDVLRVLRQRTVELQSEQYQVEAGTSTWPNTADAQDINDYGGRYGPYGVPLTTGAMQHGEEMNRAVRERLDQEAEAGILPYLAAMASYDPQSAEPVHSAVSNRDATMRSDSAGLYQADEAHNTPASNSIQYPQPALQTYRSEEPGTEPSVVPRAAAISTRYEPTAPFAPGYISWAELNAMPLNQGEGIFTTFYSSQTENSAALSMCPTFNPEYPINLRPLATLTPLTIDRRNLHNHRVPRPDLPLLNSNARNVDPRSLSGHSSKAELINSHIRHYHPNGPTCLTCKRMRRKCDRGRPACGYCVRNGQGCVYSAASILG